MTEKPFSRTEAKKLEQYRDRWSSFGATGLLDISEKLTAAELKKFDIFSEYDDAFLDKMSADISVATWREGSVLFEEGSYIDVAFYVVKGSVEVYLEKHRHVARPNVPIFDHRRTGYFSLEGQLPPDPGTGEHEVSGKTEFGPLPRRVTFLSTMDFDLPAGGSEMLGAGDIFGEIGALSGWPQSVTARTASECQLVQIRVPALRQMRRRSNALKEKIDAIYRSRFLARQLRNLPLFSQCNDAFVESLAKSVKLISCAPDEVIVREGDKIDSLYVVRSGFVKLSQAFAGGQIVVSYLSKGMLLGDVEYLIEGTTGAVFTATSVEYSELVQLSPADIKRFLAEYPRAEKDLWSSVVSRMKEAGGSNRDVKQSEFIQTALDTGLVQGNSILVIDLNTCTRCDDCVRGCAATHGELPRFVREGTKHDNFLIARSCYHCRDPVCLVGCPTGAIRRTDVGDVVAIDDQLCIGCQTCAKACPYDVIIMHPTGEKWPDDMIPEGLRGKDRVLATKCDLCYTSPAGPACVSSCPNGCAFRIGTIEEFQKLLADTR